MPDEMDEYRQFILSADAPTLIRQLKLDVKSPLTSAQNLVHMLAMMQSPSPAIQKKIDNGELNAAEMIDQITQALNQALDILDFYQSTLDGA